MVDLRQLRCAFMQPTQLQDLFRLYYPEAVRYFRNKYANSPRKSHPEFPQLSGFSLSFRQHAIGALQKFIDVLVFISDKDYLDSINFASFCFEMPQKIYDMLSQLKNILLVVSKNNSFKGQIQLSSKHNSKSNGTLEIIGFEVLQKIIEKMQKNLDKKMKLNSQINYQQSLGTPTYDITEYLRKCKQAERSSILLLGKDNIQQAISYLKDKSVIKVQQIKDYITRLHKKVALCQLDQIFCWKPIENSIETVTYMSFVYKHLKQKIKKKCKGYSGSKPQKNKKRKHKERMIRRNSIDQSSNETNETDIIYDKQFDLNINDIIEGKLQKDLIDLSDQINEEANLSFENRQLAYNRFTYIMELIGIQIKVYGSCCSGLAIKTSDIDIAVQQTVLEQYFSYKQSTNDKIFSLFQYLQSYLENFNWISNIKVINSASVPIIKFTIDNKIPFICPYSHSEIQTAMNKNVLQLNPVQIDLTVQTIKSNTMNPHLGIVSTIQTKQWLNAINNLQQICVILKYALSNNELNQTYKGGINTYTLLLLIVAVAKKQKIQNENSIVSLLERVLQFYGQVFDEHTTGIDLLHPQIFYKKPQQLSLQKSEQPTRNGPSCASKERELEVKDPLGNGKNITKNCFKFNEIKTLFKKLHNTLLIQKRRKIEQILSNWDLKQNHKDEDQLAQWINIQMQKSKQTALQQLNHIYH